MNKTTLEDENMTKLVWKDIIIRALKTFVQTFLSTIFATLVGVDIFTAGQDDGFWIRILLSAGAAAASAAWNIVKAAIEAKK
jgi:hypothetical protein